MPKGAIAVSLLKREGGTWRLQWLGRRRQVRQRAAARRIRPPVGCRTTSTVTEAAPSAVSNLRSRNRASIYLGDQNIRRAEFVAREHGRGDLHARPAHGRGWEKGEGSALFKEAGGVWRFQRDDFVLRQKMP